MNENDTCLIRSVHHNVNRPRHDNINAHCACMNENDTCPIRSVHHNVNRPRHDNINAHCACMNENDTCPIRSVHHNVNRPRHDNINAHCACMNENDTCLIRSVHHNVNRPRHDNINAHCACMNENDTCLIRSVHHNVNRPRHDNINAHCACMNENDTCLIRSVHHNVNRPRHDNINAHCACMNENDTCLIRSVHHNVNRPRHDNINAHCACMNENDTCLIRSVHHNVLEIEATADDSEIKTAYRRLIRRWHPDKNLNNVDNAKVQFQLVQQAYEILSDHQERAWYDKHRNQMLIDKDEALDVFPFFTTTCFKGFGDDENGFYAVYRSVFDKIAAEDLQHTKENNYVKVPSFGYFTSNYDKVVGPFYSFWMSFYTKKSYSWLDPYNSKDALNRHVFKLAEQKNKKMRLQAKRQRNELVRGLVLFVRKRDKRIQINVKRMEAKVIRNRQKQKQFNNWKKLEGKRELTETKPQAEWTKYDNLMEELKEIERDVAEEFGEEISDEDHEESLDLNY
ncbi:hypothetical protein FQA39_LY09312 [Lamprigera yunnana]|nr:hypothetical protein FQA39_LY09312 [Lamprigera yunnana]